MSVEQRARFEYALLYVAPVESSVAEASTLPTPVQRVCFEYSPLLEGTTDCGRPVTVLFDKESGDRLRSFISEFSAAR